MNTTTTIVKKTPIQMNGKPVSAMEILASKLACDPNKLLDTLKSTVFKNATNEELLALVAVSNTYDLNPLLKEIYAFPAKGGGIVPIVSVDGWNKMLIRQPDFDGIEFEFADDEAGNPVSCTAIIYVKGRSKPMKVTEYFDECKRNTDPWNNMPRRMLRNRTLCQASRMAFGFSGIYNDDEAATVVNVESTVIPAEPPPKMVAAPAREVKSPQAEIESLVITAGFSLNQLLKWGADTGNIEEADTIASFDEIPSAVCARLLKAQKGLLAGLATVKE